MAVGPKCNDTDSYLEEEDMPNSCCQLQAQFKALTLTLKNKIGAESSLGLNQWAFQAPFCPFGNHNEVKEAEKNSNKLS